MFSHFRPATLLAWLAVFALWLGLTYILRGYKKLRSDRGFSSIDFMFFATVTIAILAGAVLSQEPKPEPHYIMVFGPSCIDVQKGQRTTIEVPLKDGQPQWRDMILWRAVVSIKDQSCGRYEKRQ